MAAPVVISPYFVLNGIDVISYDQRGIGASTGNWQASGPGVQTLDVETIHDVFAPHMPSRLGFASDI